MKALHWSASRGKVALIETPAPLELSGQDRVVIRVGFAGVCGTDIHVMAGEFSASDHVIMGHEFTGVVTAVGSEVNNCCIGDRVTVSPNPECGSCRFCLRGKMNHCLKEGIRSTIGLWHPGGWAEYVQVPSKTVHVLPQGVSLKQAVLCEPLSCVMHGYDNCGSIPDDSRILVMGAGIIGLLWSCLLHQKGYSNVTVVDMLEDRRRFIDQLELGFQVHHPDTVRDEMAKVMPEMEGFDYIIDCTGSPRALEMAFPWLRRGAIYNIFGCCPNDSKSTINPSQFMLREVTLRGTLISPFTFPKTVHCVHRMAERYFDFDRIGIKMFSMSQFEEAFKTLREGKVSKVVFEIGGEI